MLKLYEHYHYNKNGGELTIDESLNLINEEYVRFPKNGKSSVPYFHVKKQNNGYYRCETHYYIGIDWLEIGTKAISVAPKINYQSNVLIDYMSMFFEALEDPENINHLAGLFEIDFDQPMIEIEQEKGDELTIFLIIGFLQILKHIVKVGLKKQYYVEHSVLKGHLKGKLNISQSIKQNMNRSTAIDNVCSYQVFGIDHIENQLLKKAYIVGSRYLESGIQHKKKFAEFLQVISYIRPAFEGVSDNIDLKIIQTFKPNPFYKTYEQALKFAQLILKRIVYSSSFTLKQSVTTPPYWIDMSQLFELYVFKKLREIYSKKGAVRYHVKSTRQELDFIIDTESENGEKIQFIIDAKYKPKYQGSGIGMDDARQLSGYTRLSEIYNILQIKPINGSYPLIDAMIIYPNQLQEENKFCQDIISIKYTDLKQLGTLCCDRNYTQFYKLGISLPEAAPAIQ